MIAPLVLPPDVLANLERVGPADVVVGVPPIEHAGDLVNTVRAIQAGLERHLPGHRGVIVSAEAGPENAIENAVGVGGGQSFLQVSYPLYPVHRLAVPYHGVPARGIAFRTVFEVARRLDARACAIVEGTDTAFSADCLPALLSPVLEHDYDFVAPHYLRPKYDGMITRAIVYPLTRSLYGLRVRQLIGAEFAFSARLVADCLAQDLWSSDVARYGIDISLATWAMAGGYRACQASLGARGARAFEATTDLSTMLVQVVGCVFAEMMRHAARWQKLRGSTDVPLFGRCAGETGEPADINVRPMLDAFHLGLQALPPVWALFVSPAAIVDLRKAARAPESDFRLPDDLWVRVVHDFAVGYRQRPIPREQLLQALTPLYLGWVASFVLEMREADPEAVEQRLERLCVAFETHKGELIARWRWPDRFNP
jgi:hypothetical protein